MSYQRASSVPKKGEKKPGRKWLLWSILGCGGPLKFVAADEAPEKETGFN